MHSLTAIVPLDLSQRPSDIIPKSVLLAKAAAVAGVNIAFGLNDRGTKVEISLKDQLLGYPGSTIVSTKTAGKEVNTSALRNAAFSAVSTDYTLLLDVDIWPDFDLILRHLNKVRNLERPFSILPCLYLTQTGSDHLVRGKLSVEALKQRFFRFSRKEFLHLASPSSVTVLKSSDYRELSGFDETFTGHGYEDFDFLMRLAGHYQLLSPMSDILLDRPARSPLFAVGFRRYLGQLCLDALMDKEMVFHLFHAKPKISKYYAARPSNYGIFSERHVFRVNDTQPAEPTLVAEFARLCHESGRDLNEFSILYDNKPGHVDRFDTFRRRLRFLLNE